MTKRITLLTVLFTLLVAGFPLRAQELVLPEGYSAVDSVYNAPAPLLDSLNLGRNIFHAMPAGVQISQSTAVQSAFHSTMRANPNRKISGYRIRIFFDNSQSARGASEAVAARFRAAYPGIGVYRTYESPFFKVTVGNFRNRSDAFAFLQRIKGSYPGAFVMKSDIDYPPIDAQKPFVQDTLIVVRKAD